MQTNMAVNAAGKTLCSVDFEVFGKVQGKYVCKYLFGLFFSFTSAQVWFPNSTFLFCLLLLQLRSMNFVSFVFVFRCIFSKGNQYIHSALAQLYLFIKVNVLLSLAKAWEVEMRVSKGFIFNHFKLPSAPMLRQFSLLWAKLQTTFPYHWLTKAAICDLFHSTKASNLHVLALHGTEFYSCSLQCSLFYISAYCPINTNLCRFPHSLKQVHVHIFPMIFFFYPLVPQVDAWCCSGFNECLILWVLSIGLAI